MTERIGQFLEDNRDLSGLLAHNDSFARATLASARTVGIRVPEDLKVLGVDNTVDARFSSPTLSSVELNIAMESKALSQRVLAALGRADAIPEADPGQQISLARVIASESA